MRRRGTETYRVDQAQAMSEELIDRVLAGEEIIIAEGTAKVRMVPIVAIEPKREPGTMKGTFTVDDAALAPLTDEELEDRGY